MRFFLGKIIVKINSNFNNNIHFYCEIVRNKDSIFIVVIARLFLTYQIQGYYRMGSVCPFVTYHLGVLPSWILSLYQKQGWQHS